MRTPRSLAAGLAALGLCALALPARGEDAAAAKKLFDEGLAKMQAGDFEKGCPALEASYKTDPRPGTLFTLAECEAKRGRLATAVARYDDYIALYAQFSDDQKKKQGDREKISRSQRDALGPEVPQLRLTLPSDAPKGTVVTRNGTKLDPGSIGMALRVDPGEHRITAQAPGGPVTEVKVTIGKGERKSIFLDVALPPSASKPDQGLSGQRIAAYAAGGVGLAGLVLGGVMGGLTIGKKSVIEANCGVIPEDPTACNDAGLAAASEAKTLGLVSTIGFGVGGAGAVAAVVLFLTEPKGASAAPQGVQAGFYPAPGGFTIGLRGAW
jgi:hypothetical protein